MLAAITVFGFQTQSLANGDAQDFICSFVLTPAARARILKDWYETQKQQWELESLNENMTHKSFSSAGTELLPRDLEKSGLLSSRAQGSHKGKQKRYLREYLGFLNGFMLGMSESKCPSLQQA